MPPEKNRFYFGVFAACAALGERAKIGDRSASQFVIAKGVEGMNNKRDARQRKRRELCYFRVPAP